jgi:hypothetical protein
MAYREVLKWIVKRDAWLVKRAQVDPAWPIKGSRNLMGQDRLLQGRHPQARQMGAAFDRSAGSTKVTVNRRHPMSSASEAQPYRPA